MNPGKLRDRGIVLRLAGKEMLRWEPVCTVWLQGKPTGRKNLFSRVGIGADGAEFLLRERDRTLHDAILWEGQHYFLTDIAKEGVHPVYWKVSAARVNPVDVTVKRDTVEKGAQNRPVREERKIGSFPGCVTEKYLGNSPQDSHIESEERLIVVAPKAALYKKGDRFEFGGERFRVEVVHSLENWKNEYEVRREADD